MKHKRNQHLWLGVIILGAGRSKRMGEPKLLLPWGETTILGQLLNQWQAIEAGQISVVHASDDRTIAAELDRCSVLQENRIVNPQADRGMFSSIVCAAQWKGWHASLTHWAIVLGDQPHLHRNTLDQLIEFTVQHPDSVCQPIHNAKRGHPVVLPKAVFTELARSSATDLREFLRGRKALACECSDAGLDLDIDRREDYEKALQMSELNSRK